MIWTKSIPPYVSVYINHHQKSNLPVIHYDQASLHKNYCGSYDPILYPPILPKLLYLTQSKVVDKVQSKVQS